MTNIIGGGLLHEELSAVTNVDDGSDLLRASSF
jgi:hypothetical protein